MGVSITAHIAYGIVLSKPNPNNLSEYDLLNSPWPWGNSYAPDWLKERLKVLLPFVDVDSMPVDILASHLLNDDDSKHDTHVLVLTSHVYTTYLPECSALAKDRFSVSDRDYDILMDCTDRLGFSGVPAWVLFADAC